MAENPERPAEVRPAGPLRKACGYALIAASFAFLFYVFAPILTFLLYPLYLIFGTMIVSFHG